MTSMTEMISKMKYDLTALLLKNNINFGAGEIANNLIENNVLVLPCKVGDMVYMIMPSGGIRSLTIEGIDIEVGEETKITCMATYELEGKTCYAQIQYYKFGKTVFLTKEEAEHKQEGDAENE